MCCSVLRFPVARGFQIALIHPHPPFTADEPGLFPVAPTRLPTHGAVVLPERVGEFLERQENLCWWYRHLRLHMREDHQRAVTDRWKRMLAVPLPMMFWTQPPDDQWPVVVVVVAMHLCFTACFARLPC